jgi:hypothetical protein
MATTKAEKKNRKKVVRTHEAKKRKRQIPKAYERDLNRLVNFAFSRARARDITEVQLAAKSKLTYNCILRLKSCQTRLPELLTVWKLCQALGIAQQYRILESKLDKLDPPEEPLLELAVTS